MILPDEVVIYPAHGLGSACGKNMSKETFDTLGHQKKTNYALQVGLSKETFIKELLDGLTQPPDYFPKNVLMNIQGYDSFEEVMERGNHRLSLQEFSSLSEIPGNLILDTRSAEEFSKGFIPGSINIGIDGNFAVWVGTLIKDIRQPILLITEPGREKEVIIRLARVGYDHALGYLEGGIQSWKNDRYPLETIPSITAEEFGYAEEKNPNILILDVRKKSEYDSEHIVNAFNAPLDYVQDNKKIIDTHKTYYIHCAGGYRSMSYASILKKEGYHNLINVHGGFNAIKENNTFKITNYVCPSTML
jgi:rhodanese-related sulfurtransferase